ncbi:MAG TPA: LytR C-terminal domain-containing protein [Acidimicrobiales bacterium]|nr:LytR C-terminal domain-containing protein [Acidimicrobiales bacterium]
MRPGRYAAEDGSFRRSAGMAAGRGALLLLVAVLLGIVLLNKTDDTPDTTVSQTRSTDTTTRRGAATTTTLPATTTTLPAHDPASVKVLPVNGTATSGMGGRAKDVLLGARYNALTPTDAKNKPVKTTVVFYAPGYQPDAQNIARLLNIAAPNLQPMPVDRAGIVKDAHNVAAAHVILVVGDDVAATLPAATTTTTAKSATTSTTKKPASSTTTTAKASTTSTTKKP